MVARLTGSGIIVASTLRTKVERASLSTIDRRVLSGYFCLYLLPARVVFDGEELGRLPAILTASGRSFTLSCRRYSLPSLDLLLLLDLLLKLLCSLGRITRRSN